MEFLLGIDKNFIGNLMENIIEGHQEGEVEDLIIIVDMIKRMVRLNTLLLQNCEFTYYLETIIRMVCITTTLLTFTGKRPCIGVCQYYRDHVCPGCPNPYE